MSWALQFDGVNDTLSFTGFPTVSLNIKIKISDDIASSSSYRYLYDGRLTSSTGYIYQHPAGHVVTNSVSNPKINNVSVPYADFYNASAGDIIEFDVASHGGDFSIGGRYNNIDCLEIQIEYVEVKNNSTSTIITKCTADASDHSNTGLQPALVDTIGGNNATGTGFPTDGSAWVDLGGGAVEQAITAITAEQLSQAQTVNISELSLINAITCQQASNSQLSDLTLSNQLSAITTEQVTNCSLSAIANINAITAISTEQLSQGQALNNTASQLIYAVQAQQLSQALTVSITSNGAQDVDVVVAEQITQSQIISAEELQQLQSVITQQITESINTDIEQQLALTSITAEQLTQAVTVAINESSGIFVSVVQTEQLTQAISANIDVTEIISTVITEQLSQYSAQQVSIDLTISAVIAEQLTHAELINVVLQNISNQLNIDMDQISIEMLTPTYTIEHIQ